MEFAGPAVRKTPATVSHSRLSTATLPELALFDIRFLLFTFI
jgi:hypothetical protein